jgi:glycosyltransferase 2 family protein
MKIKILDVIKYLISFAVAIGLFAYLYQGKDIGKMFSDLLTVKFEWIFASFVVTFVSHFSRGWRWSIMLKPLGYQVGLVRPFLAVMAAYFANFILPRMGEVVRSTVLQRTDNVPFQKSFGAVIAERAIDLICLILVTIATLVLQFDELETLLNEVFAGNKDGQTSNNGKLILAGIVLGGGVAVLAVWIIFRKKIQELAIYKKVVEILWGVKDGFLSVLRLNTTDKILFFVHTIVIWVGYFLTSYFLFFALPETSHLGWDCALTILAMSGVAIVAPVQGGIGVYHYLISKTLMIYDITEGSAKYFAFMAHNSQTILLIGVGSICLLITFLIKRRGSANVSSTKMNEIESK